MNKFKPGDFTYDAFFPNSLWICGRDGLAHLVIDKKSTLIRESGRSAPYGYRDRLATKVEIASLAEIDCWPDWVLELKNYINPKDFYVE